MKGAQDGDLLFIISGVLVRSWTGEQRGVWLSHDSMIQYM